MVNSDKPMCEGRGLSWINQAGIQYVDLMKCPGKMIKIDLLIKDFQSYQRSVRSIESSSPTTLVHIQNDNPSTMHSFEGWRRLPSICYVDWKSSFADGG